MNLEPLYIVAPVSSVDEVIPIIDSGADELYCGAMFDNWVRAFGDSDLISRRQGRRSHITSKKELFQVARLARRNNSKIALTLNARYSHIQEQSVIEIINTWEEAGGTSVLVSDPYMLLVLQELNSSLKIHLSIMAGTFNSLGVEFFTQFGVSRIVLPRHLLLNEVEALIDEGEKIEYEMLVMMQKCQFIDSLCGFYHGIHLPPKIPSLFNYKKNSGEVNYISKSLDPLYEGHGCQLEYQVGPDKVVQHIKSDDHIAPHCAACSLPELHNSGVRYLKIAGRGYPVDMITRSIRFISKSINVCKRSDNQADIRHNIKDLYTKEYGVSCGSQKCYYE